MVVLAVVAGFFNRRAIEVSVLGLGLANLLGRCLALLVSLVDRRTKPLDGAAKVGAQRTQAFGAEYRENDNEHD